jgi:hypothetical protein
MIVIMKRIALLFIAFLFTGFFISCEKDDSLDPRPVEVGGLYARLDITNKVMKSYDLENSYFGGMLTNPSGKIVKYNLYVKRRDGNGVSSEFAFIKEITSFPVELKIYRADLITALGLTPDSTGFGDEYFFYGESFDAQGNRADYYSLSATVQGAPGMKQAYRFKTTSQDLNYFNNPANLAEYDNYATP